METTAPNTENMTAIDAVVKMIFAINGDKKSEFYKVATSFRDQQAKFGKNYTRIQSALRTMPMQMIKLDELSGKIKGLVSISGNNHDINVFIPQSISGVIDDFLCEWKNADAYRAHKLPVRNKILLHGPTGNGKTTIARHISNLTSLPLVEVNSDSVVDSHVGATGSNIHTLFRDITQPCVVFWDEIDGIGAKRRRNDSSAASHEYDRMVNSMLVNMDKAHEGVIFICATNRKEVLDEALLRRFNETIEVPAPADHEKIKYAHTLSTFYNIGLGNLHINVTDLSSYAEIKETFVKYARKCISQMLNENSKSNGAIATEE